MTLFLRQYNGANELKDVKFSDMPINPNIEEFHFILSFANDYTSSCSSLPEPTDGNFNILWDTHNFSPSQVLAIKAKSPNVKAMVAIGRDSVQGGATNKVFFDPSPTWLSNAVNSLTTIIKDYHLDGIDVGYEHFHQETPAVFSYCIGELMTRLKNNGVISYASIAQYNDDHVQVHYKRLCKDYGSIVDYVNFKFYEYPRGTNVDQFMHYFEKQSGKYPQGKVLASDGSTGLAPGDCEDRINFVVYSLGLQTRLKPKTFAKSQTHKGSW